jgi:hypothetical protein
VRIDLITGVEVEGTVLLHGRPFEGAEIGTYGPYQPKSGAFTQSVKTDARERYHYRLPPGEAYFYVMGSMGDPAAQSRTATIPDGLTRFDVPPIELSHAVVVGGWVVDSTNRPVAEARIIGILQRGVLKRFGGPEVRTDGQGRFQFPSNTTILDGPTTRLQLRVADGSEHEASVRPGVAGTITARLPPPGAKDPDFRGGK